MKHLISLIAVLMLTACNDSESSKSKSCTYNGAAVDCSTLESGRASSNVEGKGLSLKSQVSPKIRILDNSIEVLEHTHNVQKETLSGNDFECEVSTNASDIFSFKVRGNKLDLSKDGATEEYDQLEGKSNSLQGTWRNTQKDESGSTVSTLIITEETMTIIVDCNFK